MLSSISSRISHFYHISIKQNLLGFPKLVYQHAFLSITKNKQFIIMRKKKNRYPTKSKSITLKQIIKEVLLEVLLFSDLKAFPFPNINNASKIFIFIYILPFAEKRSPISPGSQLFTVSASSLFFNGFPVD